MEEEEEEEKQQKHSHDSRIQNATPKNVRSEKKQQSQRANMVNVPAKTDIIV